MKKVLSLIAVLSFVASIATAQETFQGTVHYSFNIEGEGVEAFQAMMPTGMDIAVLKSDMSVEIKGGMAAAMMGRTLTKGKKGQSYMIKDSEETIYVMEKKAEEDPAADAKPVVTKEDEAPVTIAGYSCQKYKVVQSTPMGEQSSFIWATDKLQMPKSEGAGMGGMISSEGLPGMPMKVVTSQGPMTIVLEVTQLDRTAPAKSLFKLPKGYKQEPFDPNAMMGGGGM
jgi:hypothetical protein